MRQAKLLSGEKPENFGIVFCAMGVTEDVAEYFRRSFEESASGRVTTCLNLSSDPPYRAYSGRQLRADGGGGIWRLNRI